MSYTITEPVHMSLTGADGSPVELDLAPGEVELPADIADLLVAQGIAQEAPAKKTKTATLTEG